MIHVTARQLAARLSQRPASYLAEIAPALVRITADGGADYDETHPAWLDARQRYSVAGVCGACEERPTCCNWVANCCGGEQYIRQKPCPAFQSSKERF